MLALWHWLVHVYFAVTGAADEPGKTYGFWSGFGGTLLFSAICLFPVWWYHNNCHQHRCWRVGRHPVEGTGITTCRRHHPVLGPHRKLTAEKILHLHKAAQR